MITTSPRGLWQRLVLTLLMALALSAPWQARASTLSDNLSTTTEDTVSATGSNWLAASFLTDTALSATDSLTATLKLSLQDGAQTLALYTSDSSGLVPDSWLANFTTTSSTSDSTTFTLTGLALSSDTSYWLVLSNADGTTTWAWTADSTGTGAGFTGIWASSDDGGSTWFYNGERYPLQFSVSTITAVPEPSSTVLMLLALGLITLMQRSPLVRITHSQGDPRCHDTT